MGKAASSRRTPRRGLRLRVGGFGGGWVSGGGLFGLVGAGGGDGGRLLESKALQNRQTLRAGPGRSIAGAVVVLIAEDHGALVRDLATVGAEIADAEKFSTG